jgi:hypothetical protein
LPPFDRTVRRFSLRLVHFVDAAGGGFAKAAEGFKARLAAP